MVQRSDQISALTEESSVAYYDHNAETLSHAYESVPFDSVHDSLLSWLPSSPARIADVGAGSGRDAAALEGMGHEVFAVEPSQRLRAIGEQRHSSSDIQWIDDSLPELSHSVLEENSFDLILCSAVWMHVPPPYHRDALLSLHRLLKVSGRLLITFRNGATADRPGLYRVDVTDLIDKAAALGFSMRQFKETPDVFGRADIIWTSLVFEKRSSRGLRGRQPSQQQLFGLDLD